MDAILIRELHVFCKVYNQCIQYDIELSVKTQYLHGTKYTFRFSFLIKTICRNISQSKMNLAKPSLIDKGRLSGTLYSVHVL